MKILAVRLRNILLVATVALIVSTVVYLGVTMPPAARVLTPAPPTTIYGAYHVHTNHSDGSGSFDDVAAAAKEAGLQFVIVTDHGDATRTPDAPLYLNGVLLIDAVEIGTTSGHLVALGLRDASPYPLGAEARDTIEDVHRMGGWAIAAHPDSPKESLRWRGQAPVDGIEWLNADSEWRDERKRELLTTVGHYLVRPAEAIAAIFDRPAPSLRRWDQLARTRDIVGLAGVDAHARIGIDETEEPRKSRTLLARPSYADMFKTVVQAIALTAPLSGNATTDGDVILEALRRGQTYSVVRALASPGLITFTATDGVTSSTMGGTLASADPVTIDARVPEPADATVSLWRDGREVASALGGVTFVHTGPAASYRVEVRLPGHAVPWLVTNAIRVGVPVVQRREVPTALPGRPTLMSEVTKWVIEKHAASEATITTEGGEVGLAYRLAPGRPNGQYAAMAYPVGGEDSFDRITLTMRASAPMRVSVQVKLPAGVDGERWSRSVFVDQTPRTVTLRLQDFAPADRQTTRRPIVSRLRSLLVVVDTAHTTPGSAGTVWVSGVTLMSPPLPLEVTSER